MHHNGWLKIQTTKSQSMFKLPSDDSEVENQPQTTPKPTPKVDNSDIKTEIAYVVSSLTGILSLKKINLLYLRDYSSVKSIIASRQFYPIFTRLFSNGKTLAVTQPKVKKRLESWLGVQTSPLKLMKMTCFKVIDLEMSDCFKRSCYWVNTKECRCSLTWWNWPRF